MLWCKQQCSVQKDTLDLFPWCMEQVSSQVCTTIKVGVSRRNNTAVVKSLLTLSHRSPSISCLIVVVHHAFHHLCKLLVTVYHRLCYTWKRVTSDVTERIFAFLTSNSSLLYLTTLIAHNHMFCIIKNNSEVLMSKMASHTQLCWVCMVYKGQSKPLSHNLIY